MWTNAQNLKKKNSLANYSIFLVDDKLCQTVQKKNRTGNIRRGPF